MTITTLRPNSDVAKKAITHSTGSVAFSLIDDAPDDDATFVRVVDGNTYPSNYLQVGLTNLGAVAASQRIKQLRVRCRSRVNSVGTAQPATVGARLWDHSSGLGFPGANAEEPVPGGVDRFSTTNGSTFVTRTGTWRSQPPPLDSTEWTKAVVDRLILHLAWEYSIGSNHLNQRVSEIFVDVDIRDQPTVTGVVVSGNDASTRPTVAWSYNSNVDDDPQVAYRVKIFSAAQIAAVGFNPETSGSTWDSGERSGIPTSVQVGTDLAAGGTYRAYIKAAQDFNGGNWYSAWANSSDFVITPTPPNVPTMTVTPDPTVPWLRNIIQIQTNVDLLSSQQSSLEDSTNLTGWVAGAFTTITNTGAQAAHGTRSMQLQNTSGVSNTIFANTTPNAGGIPVKGLQLYTALASFRAAATARTCRVRVAWYDKTGVFLSDMIGSNITDSTSAWTQGFVTGAAPVNARYAAIEVQCGVSVLTAASEIHYVDKVDLHTGASVVWSPGGMVQDGGSTIVEYSWSTTGEGNYANPQLFGGGDGFIQRADGFFTFPVTGASTLEYDKLERFHSEGSIMWRIRDTDGKLYIGAPQAPEVNPTPAYPLAAVPGRIYSFSLYAKASQAFSSQLNLQAIDKDGNSVGSPVNGGAISITTSWQRFGVNAFTIPAGAVFVKAWLDNTAAVEPRQVNVDLIEWQQCATVVYDLQPSGQPTVWTPVRGAAEGELRARDEDGVAVVFDNEVPPGFHVLYRARNFLPSTPPIASADAPWVHTMMDPPGPGNWVLKAVASQVNVMKVNVTSVEESQHTEFGTFYPLRPPTWQKFNQRPVVVTDFVGGHDGTLKLVVTNEDEWYLLRQIVHTPSALFLVFPDFGARYVLITDRGWTRRGLAGARVVGADECPACTPAHRWHRELTLPFLEVDRPS